uniref:plexin-C1-like n=1 Tax=Semicossyphus pulcher TaxID=241346 RepID=UPI0037E7CA1D
MMILLPGLLLFLWGEPGRCLEEDGAFRFKGDVRHIAVANNTVYIATEEMLYQLSHKLTLVRSLTQRGILKDGPNPSGFYRVSETDKGNATFSVNILLPFDVNETLITCGVTDNGCGYCELLDLRDISTVLYREQIEVGSLSRSSASVSFLVNVESQTRAETYFLTAVQQYGGKPTENSICPSLSDAVSLHNTNNEQKGQIFSHRGQSSTPVITREGDVEFVDGFQMNSIIYLFSNLPSNDKSNKVRLLWLEGKDSKLQTLKSLRSATLSVPEGGKGSRLIASSVIPGGPPVLWSGVFSADGGPINTLLAVLDISPDLTGAADMDPDFCSECGAKSRPPPKTLKPKKVILRGNNMTSVLAVRQKAWMVFYIGTGDGQLIKLAMDKNYHTTCPRVLYRANDDRKVFPKLHLDQVDLKHVYVPFRNQINRVPVSKCNTYKTVQDCWSAQDPYCVWCGSKKSCTFEDDCRDSDWLSIPDDSQQKMVSYKVEQDGTGQITLKIQMHVTVGQNALSNFACQFSATSGERFQMENPHPQFPQCTSILKNSTLPAEGLPVVVKIRLGTTQLSEKLKLFTCTNIRGPPTSVLCRQCIEAGCGWTTSGCSWANQGAGNDRVCQMMESWTNFSRPEISSISPSVVSIYGRNHAVLSGRNLSDVTGVRIQADMDCPPQELPVWNKARGNLMFHIPSAENKGMVKVCVLLPDGSCHGSATITYRSAPSCTNISPSSTWFSGKRKITVTGSHLEFAEAVKHSKVLQEVTLPRNRSYQKLTYDSPAAENTQRIFSSTLSLKVANVTLACSKLTYYPDPEFTSFSSTRTGDDLRITIQKKADKLNMTIAELSVWGIHEEKRYPCIIQVKETSDETEFLICEIEKKGNTKFRELKIQYGDKTVTLQSMLHLYFLTLLVLLLIPCIIVAAVIIYRRKQKKLTAKMNKIMEDRELVSDFQNPSEVV